jgi:hypothetical protein
MGLVGRAVSVNKVHRRDRVVSDAAAPPIIQNPLSGLRARALQFSRSFLQRGLSEIVHEDLQGLGSRNYGMRLHGSLKIIFAQRLFNEPVRCASFVVPAVFISRRSELLSIAYTLKCPSVNPGKGGAAAAARIGF